MPHSIIGIKPQGLRKREVKKSVRSQTKTLGHAVLGEAVLSQVLPVHTGHVLGVAGYY